MTLRERTMDNLRKRRENLINGNINSIPSPFVRFSNDFIGLEQGTYYGITSYTKGGKTQFVLNLLFEAIMFAFTHQDIMRLKVFYFNLEETDEKILNRFQSWLLYRLDRIRISPANLRSSKNDSPVPEEVLDKLDSEEYTQYIDFFEKCITFSPTSNPTGIYYECRKYAEANGTVYKKSVSFNEDDVFDRYEANDPFEYRVVVIDHISLIDQERNLTKKEAIDKLSEYLAKYLRNRYNFTPIVIQQQSTENESNDSFKLNRIRPSGAGLSDSKYVQRDVNVLMGLFSPFKFGLKEYMGYDITKFKDHIRFLEMCVNRDGEMGGLIALYFDGATCTFKELPPPEDKPALEEVYRYMASLNGNSNRIFFRYMIDKIKQLVKKN